MFVPNDVVTTVDLELKVNSFLARYHIVLVTLRSKQPEEWQKQLEACKSRALKTADVQDVVEMIAFCQVEYESCLAEGTVSTLVKDLNDYATANHIKMGW